jgi:hypothetical protein
MPSNFPYYFRIFWMLLLQVLLLKRINIGEGAFNHIHFFLFPLAIMLMPFNFSRLGLLLIAFASGLIMDFFYASPGVNAAAAVLLAFSRFWIFRYLEPRGGYAMSSTPTSYSMGANWFFLYISFGTLIYVLTFFSLQAFTFVYIGQIVIKTIFSTLFSLIIMGVYALVINPKT